MSRFTEEKGLKLMKDFEEPCISSSLVVVVEVLEVVVVVKSCVVCRLKEKLKESQVTADKAMKETSRNKFPRNHI